MVLRTRLERPMWARDWAEGERLLDLEVETAEARPSAQAVLPGILGPELE